MTTQFAQAGYQEIIDLHTEADKVSVIGIHTPTGDTPRKLFKGFFDQFKKFKYLGCSLTMVPAARLPADPLSVSYEAGEPTIDPRDLMNPLMFHGCHGNDLGVILNKLYRAGSSLDGIHSDSSDILFDEEGVGGLKPNDLENLYYKALTDNTWRKAGAQSGFRKSGLAPRVYSLATTHQISNVGMTTGISPGNGALGFDVVSGDFDTLEEPDGITHTVANSSITWNQTTSRKGLQFLTPRLVSLGWMDCRSVLTDSMVSQSVLGDPSNPMANIHDMMNARADLIASAEVDTELPLIYMGVIMLPPAYKTEQYYRLIITHRFAWKGFRGISFRNDIQETPSYFDFNDVISEGGNTGGEIDPPDDPDEPGDNPGTGGGDDGPDDPDEPEPPVLTAVTLSNRNASFGNSFTMQNGAVLNEAYGSLTYNGQTLAASTGAANTSAFYITDASHKYIALYERFKSNSGTMVEAIWRSQTSAPDVSAGWFMGNTEYKSAVIEWGGGFNTAVANLSIFDDLDGVTEFDITV